MVHGISFYAPYIEKNPVLPEEESTHAIRVSRLKEGDEVNITNGKGFFFRAIITHAHPKHCGVNIIEILPQTPLWHFRLHIAIAPTKNIARMEWLVEKATEIGVDNISFLSCQHSERREIKTDRLEKIMINAMKQSQKAWMPQLTGMIALKDFISQPIIGTKYIAHCDKSKKSLLKHLYQTGENATIMVGPEGDFSTEEITQAVAQGFQPITLGPSRLRTETAALAALHTIHLLNE